MAKSSGKKNGGANKGAKAAKAYRAAMKARKSPSKEEEVGVEKNAPSEIIKPKKQKARVARILKAKEPQIVEGPKNALIIRGHKTSQKVKDAMSDIALLLKPYNKNFNRKNEVLPFEDPNSLEFLCEKNECSTFLLGTHSKKRPDNIVLGRMFDGHLLDMYEFGITDFQNVQSFSGSKKKAGSKPLLQFQGDQWESDPQYSRLQNLFVDFFRGPRNDKLALEAVDHVLAFTVDDSSGAGSKICIRSYATEFLHSGSKVPRLDLHDMGPHMDITLRRSQPAGEDLWKAACKTPNVSVEKQVKNIERNSMGDKVGKIHMKSQNLDKLQSRTRRVTALRDGKRELVDVDEDFGMATRKKN